MRRQRSLILYETVDPKQWDFGYGSGAGSEFRISELQLITD